MLALALPEPGTSIRVFAGQLAACSFGFLHCLPALVSVFAPLRLMTTLVAPGWAPGGFAPGSLASISAMIPPNFLPLLLEYLMAAVCLNCGLAIATAANTSARTPTAAPARCFLRTYSS